MWHCAWKTAGLAFYEAVLKEQDAERLDLRHHHVQPDVHLPALDQVRVGEVPLDLETDTP